MKEPTLKQGIMKYKTQLYPASERFLPPSSRYSLYVHFDQKLKLLPIIYIYIYVTETFKRTCIVGKSYFHALKISAVYSVSL